MEQLQQIEAAEPSFRSAHLYLSYIYFVSKDCRNYLLESRKAAESSHDPVELAVVAETEKGFTAGGSQGMLESLLQDPEKALERRPLPRFPGGRNLRDAWQKARRSGLSGRFLQETRTVHGDSSH